jgi:hypothetical protein
MWRATGHIAVPLLRERQAVSSLARYALTDLFRRLPEGNCWRSDRQLRQTVDMEQSPNQPRPANDSLGGLLHERHVQARISTAELIRDYSDCPERTAEAERFVREAMLEFTLGRITDDERTKILDILAFAVPPLPAYLASPDPPLWIAEAP